MTVTNVLNQKGFKAVTENDVRIIIGSLVKLYKNSSVDVTNFDPFECGCINGKVITIKDLQLVANRFYILLNLNIPTVAKESKIATISDLKSIYHRIKRLI